MKEKIMLGVGAVIMAVTLVSAQAVSIQSNVKSGVYDPRNVLTASTLRSMPVPKTGENYAILQSIGNVTSIVIGNFSSGEKSLTLIQDKSANGVVDYAATWFLERNRFQVYPDPAQRYNEDTFKKMKEDIIYGRAGGDVRPNPEGASYMLELAKRPENVRKWKQGFEVYMLDPDNPARSRVQYSVSDNGLPGADMVFLISYRNFGVMKQAPAVRHSVYTANSQDPYIREIVKQFVADVAKAQAQ